MRPKDTLDILRRPADFAVMTNSDTVRPVAAEATTDSLELTTDVVIVGGGLAGLTLAAALASAMVAGVFWAFSTFVMASLAAVPGPEGLRLMREVKFMLIGEGTSEAALGIYQKLGFQPVD